IDIDDQVYELLVKMVYDVNPLRGFRAADKLIKDVMVPVLSRIANSAQDGHRWILEVDHARLDEVKLLEAFKQAANNDTAIPPGINADTFPVKGRFVSGASRLFSSDSPVPQDPNMPFHVEASGVWRGQGFMVGKTNPADPEEVEKLVLL